MFPVTVPSSFSIVAHRGASAYAPENTMEAFEMAVRMGAREIEFDTQLASDGAIVVCHDEVLDRYGHPGVRIADTPSAELLRLDMGSHFSPFQFSTSRMPLLETILDTFGDTLTFHIELKGGSEHLAGAVFAQLKQRGIIDHCIVCSFLPSQLARMRDLDEHVRLAWLVQSVDKRHLAAARELDLFQINPPARCISQEIVAEMHEIVEEVQPWEICGGSLEIRAIIDRLVTCGCDGMTIDWPDRVIHAGV